MTHDLKTWPAPFHAVIEYRKRFDIRRLDRPFSVGDDLVLREWDPRREVNDRYTGRFAVARVTYISERGSYGLPDDVAVLSIEVRGHR